MNCVFLEKPSSQGMASLICVGILSILEQVTRLLPSLLLLVLSAGMVPPCPLGVGWGWVVLSTDGRGSPAGHRLWALAPSPRSLPAVPETVAAASVPTPFLLVTLGPLAYLPLPGLAAVPLEGAPSLHLHHGGLGPGDNGKQIPFG